MNHCAAKVIGDRTKKQKRKMIMRIQYSSMMSWRAMWLLAGLTVLSQATDAQQVRSFRGGGVAGGARQGFFVQKFDGSGPARGVMIVINGQDVGASLLKACDANQDGTASADEVKGALLNWFQQADTDTNGALSEVELATRLKTLFPTPEPPPGVPALPEDQAIYNLLAKKLMATVDANSDTWITFKEALIFLGQNFSKWDMDSSGSLDASEFAAAFAQFMPAPSLHTGGSVGIGFGAGPSFNSNFDR
jgi:Ca2+-binding EF-hand superfamily protein